MPVTVIQMFAPTVLTTSAATLYTSAGATTTVTAHGRVRFTNTTNTTVTVTAYAVPSGGTAGAGNCFLEPVAGTITPYGFLDVDVPVLALGSFIQALASANTSVTAFALDAVVFT